MERYTVTFEVLCDAVGELGIDVGVPPRPAGHEIHLVDHARCRSLCIPVTRCCSATDRPCARRTAALCAPTPTTAHGDGSASNGSRAGRRQCSCRAPAALAARLAHRRAAALGTEDTFASEALVGVAIAVDDHPAGWRDVVEQVRAVARTGGAPGPFAAACFELAHLLLRVGVSLDGTVDPAPRQAMIDVGRIAWDELAGEVLSWLPIGVADADVVGGRDCPWTRDPPAAGSMWRPDIPGLSLDPEWRCAILADPTDGELYVLAPDASW